MVMEFEAGRPGQRFTPELWQTVCCRYYNAGRYAAGRRVLEVGCGAGRGLDYLAARAADVIGGDYSPRNLDYARTACGDRTKLLLLDGRRLPFRDCSFGLVLAMEVVQYLPTLEPFLDESRRVLAEDGVLIFCLPNRDIPGFTASPASRRHYAVPELAEQVTRHGFSPEVFGATPITGSHFKEGLRARFLAGTGRLLDRLWGGERVKEWLGGLFLGRKVVGKTVISETDIDTDACRLYPLDGRAPEPGYRTIYVVARRR